jgi:hypothetical protein
MVGADHSRGESAIAIAEQSWPPGTVPLLTVWILTFKHEAFIRQCLDGVLKQRTTFPVQVLVHEDASPDRTAEIVQSYERKYPRLIEAVCEQRNTLRSGRWLDALRSFVALSRGKYEAVCEGDDYWTDPLKLEKQVKFLEQQREFSGCFHAVNTVDEADVLLPPCYPRFRGAALTLQQMLWRHYIPTASFVYRRELFQRSIPFRTPMILSGDMFLEMSCAVCGPIGFLSETMGTYRRHSGGITASALHNDLRRVRDADVALFKALAVSSQHQGRDPLVFHPRLAAAYFASALTGVRSGRLVPAIRDVVRTFHHVLGAPQQCIRQAPLIASSLLRVLARRAGLGRFVS